jgi:hypothetical protein
LSDEHTAKYESRFHRLLEKASQDAPAWKHDGDTIMGLVVDLDTYVGEYGEIQTVTIEAAEGSTEEGGTAIPAGELRTVYAGRTVLRKKVEKEIRSGLKVDDPIVVRHFGIPEGREYHDYAVKAERADPEAGDDQLPLDPVTSGGDKVADDAIPF